MRLLARNLAPSISCVLVGACLADNPAFVDTSIDEMEDDGDCPADEREPDDDEAMAHALGPLNDDAPVLSIEGTIEHATAQDWYTFVGRATSGLEPQPRARASTSTGAGSSVCVFVECSGGIEVSDAACPDPEAEHTHTMGLYRPGCCALDESSVQPICTDGVLDDMTVLVRVAATSPTAACAGYVLELFF